MIPILNYITWDVSPFIYEGEHFAIGWYGTLWTLGLVGLLLTLLLTFKHDKMPTQFALITFMVTLVCVIFFGHLFQGLFYEWYYSPNDTWYFLGIDWDYRNHYFDHPWRFFDFAHGGFSSHGTAVGILVAGWLTAKILPINAWFAIDRGMMGLCWLGMTVRLGNFINGEICGIETTMPWGIIYGEETIALHPSQIYEMLTFAFAFGVACWMFVKYDAGKYRGLLAGTIMSIDLLLRIWIEFYKLPNTWIEDGWVLDIGQWLSIPLAIYGVWLVFYSIEQGKYETSHTK